MGNNPKIIPSTTKITIPLNGISHSTRDPARVPIYSLYFAAANCRPRQCKPRKSFIFAKNLDRMNRIDRMKKTEQRKPRKRRVLHPAPGDPVILLNSFPANSVTLGCGSAARCLSAAAG
jgi:hypothetical protein